MGRARGARSQGIWLGAFGSLVARNRRRYGGYVVHASIVLLAIGVAGSSAYDTIREARLRPGQTMEVGRLHARLPAARRMRAARTRWSGARVVDVERDGERSGR